MTPAYTLVLASPQLDPIAYAVAFDVQPRFQQSDKGLNVVRPEYPGQLDLARAYVGQFELQRRLPIEHRHSIGQRSPVNSISLLTPGQRRRNLLGGECIYGGSIGRVITV